MKRATLLFLLKEDAILLAMKKRGSGAGKWNGVGGKVEPGETIEAATRRECEEEIGVVPGQLEKVAIIDFQIPSQDFHNVAHVYITREWQGKPVETEEMMPRWFSLDAIPYDEMWSDDRDWLPKVLRGERFSARFLFDSDEQVTEREFTTLRQ